MESRGGRDGFVEKPKILVVGDAMVDAYHFGITTRISPEAPIPVVKVLEEKVFDGGARNVEQNLKTLGANVRTVYGYTVVDNETATQIPEKHRLMVGNTQVARWDRYDQVQPIEVDWLNQMVFHWAPDAIVVSDYGKGSINYDVSHWINQQKLPTFVDTKGSPGLYRDDFTFFPNIAEFETHEKNYRELENVIYKCSADGIRRLHKGRVVESFRAYADRVVSVCGAGDSVLSGYVYAVLTKHPNPLQFANAAAAVVVEKPYTATATLEEINAVLARVS